MVSVRPCPESRKGSKGLSRSSSDCHIGVRPPAFSRQGTFPLTKASGQTATPVSAAGILSMRKGVSFSSYGESLMNKALCLPKSSKSTPRGRPKKSLDLEQLEGGLGSRRRRNSLPSLQVAIDKGPAKIIESDGFPLRRRRSLPCASDEVLDKARALSRHVRFGEDDDCSPKKEFYEAFTPYSKKYGAHPTDFFFDSGGRMVLATSHDAHASIDKVKENDTIECVVDMGVDYRTKPQMSARFEEARTVALGDQVLVKACCDEWVQDSIGWLPLRIKDEPMFQVVVPKEKLQCVRARVPVMTAAK